MLSAANAGTTWRSLVETALDTVSTALDEVERTAERQRRRTVVPQGNDLANITRHDAHLNRTLVKMLHELEAAQARREGRPAPLARFSYSGSPFG